MMCERYVICSLIGGLGNRMFIYTAAYIINIVYGHDIYLLDKPNPHSKLNYTSLFKAKKRLDVIDLPGITIGQKSAFSIWDMSFKPQLVLNGYFQYYPAIKPHEDNIRSYFKSVLSPYINDIQTKYKTENTGFIHIRRGDYKNKSDYHYLQSIEYYTKAVHKLKETVTRFYIFTDDQIWVKEQDLFRGDNYILFEGNEIDSLALMSVCKSGAICANSTFSWWGAFLGAYEKRNPVIVPEKWINEPYSENLIPQDWVRI